MRDGMEMAVREMRRKKTFTAITRKGAWSNNQIALISEKLSTMVYGDSRFLSSLVLDGEFSKAQIAAAIGFEKFEWKTAIGFNNPALPFPAPWQ